MTPPLPGHRSTRPASQRHEATWIALVFVIGIVSGLLALISMILPDIFGVLLVLAAFGGFIALHYFTWGRWLIRKTTPAAEAARQSPASPSVSGGEAVDE